MMPFGIGTSAGKRCHLEALQDTPRKDVSDYGWVIEPILCMGSTRCEILVRMDNRLWVNFASLRYKHDGTFLNLPKAKPLLG